MRRVRSLQDVVDWDLCTGCGACFYACTEGAVLLVNVEPAGIRPRFTSTACESCTKCLSICPGYTVDCSHLSEQAPLEHPDGLELGPLLEIWQGFATDPEIRFKGSSGGVLSAIALYCLERENMSSVLHTEMDEAKPWTNKTCQSTSRADILRRTGSRYAPASPCDGLQAVEDSHGPCVFIGKPCDAAAVSKLAQQRPALSSKLGLILSFFCAGTPSTRGTMDLINVLDTSPEAIESVRYRGDGWPGQFTIQHAGSGQAKSLSYEESWGKLSSYRPLRCHLCPDGMGALADISCGDAWQEFDQKGNPGLSIVIVRTQRGRQLLHRAIEAQYITLIPIGATDVIAAQPNLVGRRKELFGRLLGMRMLFVPGPRFPGFCLYRSWCRITFGRKIRTVLGTMRRMIFRRLLTRRQVF